MRELEWLNYLLKSGERIKPASAPWPIPKAGDHIRALVRFDIDPGKVLENSWDGLRRQYVDCVVWKVDRGSAGGCWFVYYNPIEKIDALVTISTQPTAPDAPQSWSGVDVVSFDDWPSEYIPLAEIERLPFLKAVEDMKAHLDRRAAWQ